MEKTKQQQQIIERYVLLFNNIEANIAFVDDIVSPEIEFLDPFHHLFGRQKFTDMLLKTARQVKNPSFDVTHQAWDQSLCFLRWNFTGNTHLLGDLHFSGMSEIHLDDNNKVLRHIDHWDSVRYVYRRLPIIKQLFKLFGQ